MDDDTGRGALELAAYEGQCDFEKLFRWEPPTAWHFKAKN
jgi:hypothetical protein